MTAAIVATLHLLGIVTALNALMTARTSQGSVAWILSLVGFPYVALPAYWIFGRNKFNGYVTRRREIAESNDERVSHLREQLSRFRPGDAAVSVGERLAELPYLTGNEVELLIDGTATFESIFAGIDKAQKSILVQFYIVHDDELGRELKTRLIERAKAGVTVYFVYDELGSAGLPRAYVSELREAGVEISPFHSTRGRGNRFQLNFRNHRKIVVVDSEVGWVGGHNVGDEYLGKDESIGAWRDTHLRIRGPAVAGLIISFCEDWRWATERSIFAELPPVPAESFGDASVLVVPTGPADRLETAGLMFQEAISAARERVWIASPYFVPDKAIMHTLHLAALRGVDVRILIPESPDSKLVYYAAYAFVGELLDSGIRVLRHSPGFLHEKVFLIDGSVSSVGTANFDNRSFRLNFEVTAIIVDSALAQQVEAMFEHDFATSTQMSQADLKGKPMWFRMAARASYLTAPLL